MNRSTLGNTARDDERKRSSGKEDEKKFKHRTGAGSSELKYNAETNLQVMIISGCKTKLLKSVS